MEKLLSLLTRISELYNIPQWIVNSGAIAICVILVSFPFIAHYLMRPKYHRYKEMILFKVLWRWKYKKGDIIGLWCFCPKCQSMLMCDDENCRSTEVLQDKITYFICHECGGHELSRVVGGDRRYVLSLVRRDIWRHIREGSYNDVASATKEALEIYQELEASKEQAPSVETPLTQDLPANTVVESTETEVLSQESDSMVAEETKCEEASTLCATEESLPEVTEEQTHNVIQEIQDELVTEPTEQTPVDVKVTSEEDVKTIDDLPHEGKKDGI